MAAGSAHLAERATAPDPVAGYVILWSDTSHALHALLEDGTDVTIGAASGALSPSASLAIAQSLG